MTSRLMLRSFSIIFNKFQTTAQTKITFFTVVNTDPSAPESLLATTTDGQTCRYISPHSQFPGKGNPLDKILNPPLNPKAANAQTKIKLMRALRAFCTKRDLATEEPKLPCSGLALAHPALQTPRNKTPENCQQCQLIHKNYLLRKIKAFTSPEQLSKYLAFPSFCGPKISLAPAVCAASLFHM